MNSYDLSWKKEKKTKGEIKDTESLESALSNEEDKKRKYINQRENHIKYVNVIKDIKEIEEKLDKLKKEKDPLDTIYE